MKGFSSSVSSNPSWNLHNSPARKTANRLHSFKASRNIARCFRHQSPPATTARHCTALHCTALNGTERNGTAQHSTAQHSTAQHSAARHGTAWHGGTGRGRAQGHSPPGNWCRVLLLAGLCCGTDRAVRPLPVRRLSGPSSRDGDPARRRCPVTNTEASCIRGKRARYAMNIQEKERRETRERER